MHGCMEPHSVMSCQDRGPGCLRWWLCYHGMCLQSPALEAPAACAAAYPRRTNKPMACVGA